MENEKHLARIEVTVDKDESRPSESAARHCGVSVEGTRGEILHALVTVINAVSDSTGIPQEILLPILAAGCKGEKASRTEETDLSELGRILREAEE